MSDHANDIDDSKAPLMEHLIELRKRLLISFGALVVAFGVAYTQRHLIFGFLVQPLVRAYGPHVQGRLIYTKLYEAFFVEIKVAAFAAFVLAFPVIASQLWAFVAPGLYRNEKRAFLPFMLATPFLFTCGAALAYYVVAPIALKFLLNIQPAGVDSGLTQEALPSMESYLALVMQFIVGFGVAFLLPVLLMLLERAGILSRRQLQDGRRYAIVGATIVGAILAPPDVLSQVLLAVPLILLYELSIIGIWFTERRRAKDARRLPVVQS